VAAEITSGDQMENFLQKHPKCSHLLPTNCTHETEFFFEKLIVPQLLKELAVLYGTRRFVTLFTTALLSILGQTVPVDSVCPIPSRYITLTYPTIYFLGLPSCLFNPVFLGSCMWNSEGLTV